MSRLFCVLVLAFLAGCSGNSPPAGGPAVAPAASRFDDEATRRLIRLDRLEGENHRALQR